jgi:nicotinamide-nucleotide amidase
MNKPLLEKLGKKLIAARQTVAVAESVTTGLLQQHLGAIPDARKCFQGGITTYNLGQKMHHLLVEPIHAEEVNCISQKVATQMAIAVSTNFRSDWGLAITGYATPAPESGGKLFAYYAIIFQGKLKAKGKITAANLSPARVQQYYTDTVLKKWLTCR